MVKELIDTEIEAFMKRLISEDWLIPMGSADTQYVAGKIFSALEPYMKGEGIK